MFRWFKDRKKQRREGQQRRSREDDYGFKTEETAPRNQPSSEYGFGENASRQFRNQDSPYHIYEEIRDLPDIAPFGNNVNSENRLTSHRHSEIDTRGTSETSPYMIVPLIGKCESENDVRPDVPPLCSNIQHGNKTCRCFNRNKTELRYNEPWDKDAKFHLNIGATKERTSGDLSIEQIDRLHHMLRGSESVVSFSSESSDCSQSQIEQDGNDTCCEYDMSTSSESDCNENSTYNFYISKIEENLSLKHNVRKIIEDLDKSSNRRRNSDTDLESEFTVSSLSSFSSQPTLTCCETSDTAALADKSESEDSSGYYECFDEKPESPVKISPVLQHKHEKCKQKKHRTHQHKVKDLSLDDEMYLLPANKRNSSCIDFRVYKTPIQAPPPSSVYEDPYRARGRNHNRLLSDLIRMNYDRQLMV